MLVSPWALQVSLVVALYATYLQPKPGWPVAVSGDYMIVFQLTSFAVALLLVFRTNTAHSRWWEVRRRVGVVGQGQAGLGASQQRATQQCLPGPGSS